MQPLWQSVQNIGNIEFVVSAGQFILRYYFLAASQAALVASNLPFFFRTSQSDLMHRRTHMRKS
jgi:hypothetical protein